MIGAARRKLSPAGASPPARDTLVTGFLAPSEDVRATERDFVERAVRVAADAAEVAEVVDREARFPHEAFEALRRERLLGLMIPRAMGGPEAGVGTIAEICNLLAQRCASTGMIYAMHQIKVSSIVVHAQGEAWQRGFMGRIASEQLLLGSATTEGGGVGGDLRTSRCGLESEGEEVALDKEGCLISYGEQADAILITARRSLDAAAGDQVLAVMDKTQYRLERTGAWDTMGMRGTCSHSFRFGGRAPRAQVLATPFADIAAQSMLPYAHLLWAAVWCGIASDAVGRAEAFVRAEARKKPGTTPPGAARLVDLLARLQSFKALIAGGIARYERVRHDPDELTALGFVIAMNTIKIQASEAVAAIVDGALLVCGIAGFRNDGPFSLSRAMRDAASARIMINNDRILGNTAQLVAAHRRDPSLFR